MGVGYGSFGRALYHRIRFNSSSGARSYSAKFILLDSFEKTDCAVFFAFKSTCGVIAAQVMAEGAFWKQLNIGVAPEDELNRILWYNARPNEPYPTPIHRALFTSRSEEHTSELQTHSFISYA